MINEGGKWAHVVLRKCVFEPKAAGISSLMHQPSTGHLRTTVCCAVSSVSQWSDAASILLKLPCIHSLSSCFTFFFSFFLFFCFLFYPLHPSMPFLHFVHTSFVSFNYPFPAFLPFSLFSTSLIYLPPLSLPPFSTMLTASLGLHTLYNSISVFCVCFLLLCDLSSFLALERWPTLSPHNPNTEQSFNLCDSLHHRLV